jgi:hypothetical protein
MFVPILLLFFDSQNFAEMNSRPLKFSCASKVYGVRSEKQIMILFLKVFFSKLLLFFCFVVFSAKK